MAPRKKNQTPAEQTAQEQEQKNIQPEQDADALEQTEPKPEQDTDELEQDGQKPEQDADKAEQTEPERDEFANIPNPCVYCGPSVRSVARQYTTYQGGIPNELKEFIKAHPAVRRLIVSTGQFASVRKRMETPGTAEAAIYKKVKAEL